MTYARIQSVRHTMRPDETSDPRTPPLGGSERMMQTFRLPRPLVATLKAEAVRRKRDLTAQVLVILEGVLSYFGLPRAAVALLEADREALGMERDEYLLHVLYERSAQLRDRARSGDVASVPGP
jgi:hypothetical protein